MTKINFIGTDGSISGFEAQKGDTVMEVATRNGVLGIDADCGGSCSCATCLVYVDDAFRDLVGPPNVNEEQMLEFAEEVRPESRLSCQIKISDELDGLTVTPA